MLVGQTQKKISKAGRIEDVGVEQRRKEGHGLLQAKVLIDGGQLIQYLAAMGFHLAAVLEDVASADTAMRAYLAEGDTAGVQKPHEVRS